jgi:type IV pilus assembly protein PilY1
MPSAPAVADYNDDGYLDVVYIGDVNGNMWRIDLTPQPSAIPQVGVMSAGQLHNYAPYLLFNGCGTTANTACPNSQPIFYEPGIVYVGGTVNPPTLGIAFGTGDRAELARPNVQNQAFYYVIDSGQTTQTFVASDLHDLSPGGSPPSGGPCPLPIDPATCTNAENGFFLPYETDNEKTTSTVFSTIGYLSLITFTPDSTSPCETNGSSFRYRFFFLTGEGYYGTNGDYGDYQQDLGTGFASATQSVSPQGDVTDIVLRGEIIQEQTPGTVRALESNWKEQQ